MTLFQNSVLRNYLENLDTTLALQAYEVYKSDFLPKIENIKSSKEEQYQYGFLNLMKKTGALKHHQSTVYSLEIKVYLQMAVKK